MKLPGDSDKQQGVSHEMMQRSLQSQRRVVKRVGLLEDRVSELETAEVEPGIELGDVADGAKKIATKIGDKAKDVGKSIGKNAQLLGDKAGKAAAGAAQAAGEKIGQAKDAVGEKIGQGTERLTNVGKGLRNFIKDKAKAAKAFKLPGLPDKLSPKPKEDPTTGKPKIAPKAEPQQNLVPDPVAAMGVDPKTGEYLSKEDRIKKFKERRSMREQGIDPDNVPEAKDIEKVDTLEEAGIGKDDTKKKVKKELEDEFEVDPKMKKAFMEALALPAKSAAVAITDLLEKIPAPSKEASKILNRNIAKLSSSFKLGAASSEVANDEADNDSDDKVPKWMQLAGKLVGKVINRVKGNSGGGGEEAPQLPSAPQQNLLPGAAGDPTHGRRAPYTGTADGIGLGDGSGRAMQPIKKRKSAAAKLFGMTPMGMAFNAGNTMFKGAKSFTQSKAFNNIKNIGGKALGMTPMGMMAKFMMKGASNVKNLFSKGEQKVNLTELTDKTIQENRASADAKTQKQVDLAAGTGDAIDSSMPSAPSYDQEGGALAQPNIKESPYLDVYNVTSQF